MRQYLNNIGKVPLLTPAEEIQLGRTVRAMQEIKEAPDYDPTAKLSKEQSLIMRRGKRALDRMVAANLRMVVSIAVKYQYKVQTLTLDDLIQDGTLGLIRACERFDPSRGYKLSTYSYWWIRQCIMRGIMMGERVIRLPIHTHEHIQHLFGTIHEHMKRTGYPPTVAELAEMEGKTEEQIRSWLDVALPTRSLDATVTHEGDSGTLMEFIADTTPIPMDDIEHDPVEGVHKILCQLSEKEHDIITRTNGINGTPQVTLSEIGKQWNISRERVRQLRTKAERKLLFSAHRAGLREMVAS